MPLNLWNVSTFRAIGSNWGHFIEADEKTLKEISFDKGRILLATENPNRIASKIQLIVDGKGYIVRVEKKESFRIVGSSKIFYSSGSKRVGEDDDVGRSNDDMEHKGMEK
ncbi:hypothetical protein RHGRI_013259 [Rhododendron griersonianum]|uniref:DUF4283 domain-containing protein n=1 Tax=Rhododendron griersonianum TaxID=479676 RepID=A0AAV6K4W5_9ERIC|nr:hypothetical protein RHGRI_013259 [Rhododendron griersonianum]